MDIDEVRKVARLARLDLPEADLAVFARQLTDILGYVDQLRELNTDAVEPLAHPLPVQNVFRPDELRPSLPVEEALRNAPARSGDFFAVPAVLDPADDQSHS
jgi:aspartyl-tRNA(Asn)/glutamyl-tRNA(Gln) amidotransferase subunit C